MLSSGYRSLCLAFSGLLLSLPKGFAGMTVSCNPIPTHAETTS